MRGVLCAVVMRPNVAGLFSVAAGLPLLNVLVRLMASARSSIRWSPPSSNDRLKAWSHCQKPGPRSRSNVASPSVPGAGCENAAMLK